MAFKLHQNLLCHDHGGTKAAQTSLSSQLFIFFDEGGRSIFNIQYQYLERGAGTSIL